MIGEKVRQISIYTKRMKDDDLSEIGKQGYADLIKGLTVEIEEMKFKYETEIDMSEEDIEVKSLYEDDGDTVVSKSEEMDSDTLTGDEEDRADEPLGHDAYSVRRDYRELFGRDETHDDTRLSDWDDMAEAMNEMGMMTVEPVIEEEPEPIIDDSVIGKLKASVGVPEEFKFADNMTFYTMLRNIFRGKNILVTGPSGCGKSSLGKILAEITNKPFYSFNFGDTMNPSAKILGDTKFSKEEGTWFKPSRFVSAITDNSGAFIMLDEITRDRTGDLANILMPVLDGQKYLALDESEDADMVNLDSGAFFYATANIGREYLGCAHDLDRAWKDRFCGGLYELEYLPQKKEQELIMNRVPKVKEDDARRITEFANKIRGLYKAEELNVAVSTRMCLTTAELVVDGMNLLDALKHTVLPFYPIQGGDDTERVKVLQSIQSMGD
tara:strand:- start:273 stop:1589 length:1317 start_codon:yes stop_codon:yes gene_type:complete